MGNMTKNTRYAKNYNNFIEQGLCLTPLHTHFGHPQRDRTNRWHFNMAAPIIGNPLAECIFIICQYRHELHAPMQRYILKSFSLNSDPHEQV